MSTVDERMAELEIRQAFQDDALQMLSDVVADQQKQIDRLNLELQRLRERQEEHAQQYQDVPNEPPPHY
ncbi:SlyX family protein [Thiopseudomonas denitrificans]|uniref:Protein SlyX homolog n=1 Tax=Thiopseudomonas denitrificans TaxID=1501432 RepID=A0A4V3D527_9GAMM|nr:SlyX family protein [Thiopseudomonas denitrificans]TDQ38497.1 SlyX protein [Thiopseudomonas denitrificans]